MRQGEIETVRGELESFVQDVFASLARKDQRAKGGLYLQGLMLEGRHSLEGRVLCGVPLWVRNPTRQDGANGRLAGRPPASRSVDSGSLAGAQ